jgi:hypothetical protein
MVNIPLTGSTGFRSNFVRLFLLYIAIVVLIALRKPDAFLNPQPWAEDGTTFIQQALSYGILSLAIPYQGYLHLIPRIVTLVALPFGLPNAPFAMNLFALLLSALSVWYLCLRRFRVIVKNDLTRYMLSFLIAAIPVHEIFMTITNVQWFLSLFLTLWTVDQWINYRSISERTPVVVVLEAMFAAFAFLTAILGILLLPIIALVFVRRIRDGTLLSHNASWILVPFGSVLLDLSVFSAFFFSHPATGIIYPLGGWYSVAKLSVLHVVLALLIPISIANSLVTASGLISLGLSAILLLSTILLIYTVLKNKDGLGFVLLALIGLDLVLTAVFRPNWMFSPIGFGERFLFYPMCLLVLFLVRVGESHGVRRGKFLIGVILVVLTFNAALHYQIPPYADLKWGAFSNEYNANGTGFVVAPINPVCSMPSLPCWNLTIPVDPQLTASKLKLLTQVNGGEGGLYYLNGGITSPGQIYNVTSDTGPFINVVGWAIDQGTGNPAKGVFLVIDGNLAFPTAYGLGPPEFQYGPSTQPAQTDWWTIISTQGLSPGTHIISIWVIADDGLHYYSIQIATLMK